jgi:hypothetical protein
LTVDAVDPVALNIQAVLAYIQASLKKHEL